VASSASDATRRRVSKICGCTATRWPLAAIDVTLASVEVPRPGAVETPNSTGCSMESNESSEETRARLVAQSARHRRHRPNSTGRRSGGGKHLSLWYDSNEYGDVAIAAARAGLTPTSFVAAAALAVARDTKPPVPSPMRDLLAEFNTARTLVGRFGTNVNQAVATLHATGQALPALARAVEVCTRAAERLDHVVARIQQRLP
jgi:hypothetical protein